MEQYVKRPLSARAVIILAVGLLAASQSGNLIRIGNAHFIAIAAWRLLLASILTGGVAGRHLARLKDLTKKETLLLIAAGVALSLHFFTWIGAVQYTTVANAAMAFSVNPIFTAAAALFFFKEPVSKRLALSIAAGIIGVGVICGSDFSFERAHVTGDLLAVLSAVFFMMYFLLGKRLQQRLPTPAYVSAVYGIASLAAFCAAPFANVEILHFDGQTWLCFALMALIPTMIGHTALNYSVRYFDAGRISAATLVEPLFAGVVAYLAYGERVSPASLLGYVFIAASVVLVALDVRRGSSSPK